MLTVFTRLGLLALTLVVMVGARQRSDASVPAAFGREHPALAATLAGCVVLEDYDTPFVRATVADMERVPLSLYRRLRRAGLREIHVGNRPLTELIGDPWYATHAPRGWPAGSTFAVVPSIFDGTTRRIFIASARTGSRCSIGHELGHASLDLLHLLHESAIASAHRRCYPHLAAYYRQGGPDGEGREELFAETLAIYVKEGRPAATRFADVGLVDYIATVIAPPDDML